MKRKRKEMEFAKVTEKERRRKVYRVKSTFSVFLWIDPKCGKLKFLEA